MLRYDRCLGKDSGSQRTATPEGGRRNGLLRTDHRRENYVARAGADSLRRPGVLPGPATGWHPPRPPLRHTCQLDLKTAFLNVPLDETIYCSPVHDQLPLTIKLLKKIYIPSQRKHIVEQIKLLKKGYVLRMLKVCYGLKQAPRQWWKELNKFFNDLGFRSIHSDICFYVLHLAGRAYALLLLYVDDILLAATMHELVLRYSSLVARRFKVSNSGPLENYLNIAITHIRKENYITMNMATFCKKALKHFGVTPKPAVTTPLPKNFNVTLEEELRTGNSELIENF